MAKRAFPFFRFGFRRRGEANDHTTQHNTTQQLKILFQSLFLAFWVSGSVWTFCATVGEFKWVGPMLHQWA